MSTTKNILIGVIGLFVIVCAFFLFGGNSSSLLAEEKIFLIVLLLFMFLMLFGPLVFTLFLPRGKGLIYGAIATIIINISTLYFEIGSEGFLFMINIFFGVINLIYLFVGIYLFIKEKNQNN